MLSVNAVQWDNRKHAEHLHPGSCHLRALVSWPHAASYLPSTLTTVPLHYKQVVEEDWGHPSMPGSISGQTMTKAGGRHLGVITVVTVSIPNQLDSWVSSYVATLHVLGFSF